MEQRQKRPRSEMHMVTWVRLWCLLFPYPTKVRLNDKITLLEPICDIESPLQTGRLAVAKNCQPFTYRKIAMELWKYQCYKTSSNPNLWSEWYHEQSKAVQAKHDSAFEFLEARLEWTEPKFKHLKGKYAGLGEVRLQGDVQWRIFGFRRTHQNVREFVVTHTGSHKGNVYQPKDVLDTALKRVEEAKVDPGKTAPCARPVKA
jgi:hypothetical protein